jgi:hypothetical protein
VVRARQRPRLTCTTWPVLTCSQSAGKWSIASFR